MFHETYMDGSEGWKAAIMGRWQKHFFRRVGRTSDLCLFSTEPWSSRYASWFPESRIACLPVASNIPVVVADKSGERARLGIPDGIPCMVVFGGLHPSRLFDWIAEASRALARDGVEHRLLHIGPDSNSISGLLAGSPLMELGILPAEMVSRALTAGDILLAPISDGASTRRGSLLAGLEHGLCCITTPGPGTDRVLLSQDGISIKFARGKGDFIEVVQELATHPDRVREFAGHATTFSRSHFTWESIADNLLHLLERPGD
jgi:glycosyltransferase involved in cell wall biosynthesis